MNDIRAFLRRLAVPLCALLLLVVGMAFPRTERKQRVRVAPGTWPGAETLLLANDLNKLPASRFQVIEIPWSSAVMRALGNGAADVAVVTLDSVLRMRESGQKLRVLMVLDQSTGGMQCWPALAFKTCRVCVQRRWAWMSAGPEAAF